jgi:hypothetical protein
MRFQVNLSLAAQSVADKIENGKSYSTKKQPALILLHQIRCHTLP